MWNEFWGAYQGRRWNNAIVNAKRYATHNPTHFSSQTAQSWMGRIHERRGEKEAACSVFSTLMGRSPGTYYGWRAQHRYEALCGPQARSLVHHSARSQGGPARHPLVRDAGPHGALPPWRPRAASTCRTTCAVALLHPGAALPPAVRRRAGRPLHQVPEPEGLALLPPEALRRVDPLREGRALPELPWVTPPAPDRGPEGHVDPFLLAALVRGESRFNPTTIKSYVGATGLARLMPPTAKWALPNVPDVAGRPLTNPYTNLRLGGWYLAYTHRVFDGRSMPAIAAYNGGPGAVQGWLGKYGGDPDEFVESIPYSETRLYVKKVFSSYWNYAKLYSGNALEPTSAFMDGITPDPVPSEVPVQPFN